MRMGKKQGNCSKHEDFINSNPDLSVLTDHPIHPFDLDDDCFSLRYHVGPLYDIIRNPDTKMPMAVGIYGKWGYGKTSAMKWLQGAFDKWNELPQSRRKGNIQVEHIWFYPWKYQTREDVWRGLISELIIKSIKIQGADIQTVTKAVRQFGKFLGRGFLHVLSGIKLKMEAGVNVGVARKKGGVEFDGAQIMEIANEYERIITPEKAYLNEFETTFKEWIRSNVGPDKRLVVFIDDLDRCLPDVALQVLEALKLYLDTENLVIIIGIDREVINQMLSYYYRELGVDRKKSEKYLAKMFQVEIELNPSHRVTREFLDRQLEQVESFDALDEVAKEVFSELILDLSERNPREIKRLINNALIAGSGYQNLPKGSEGEGLTLEQGMQRFFLRKILEDEKGFSGFLRLEIAHDFFSEWSNIIKTAQESNSEIPFFIKFPTGYIEAITEGVKKSYDPSEIPEASIRGMQDKISLDDIPEEYHEFIRKRKFVRFHGLLGNSRIGLLMRIPYPRDTSTLRTVEGFTSDEEIVRRAVAKELGKNVKDIVESDFEKVEKLDLAFSEISSLESLRKLKRLKSLRLFNAPVSDISAIANLTNLTNIDLSYTNVRDISHLADLTNLTVLSLWFTPVREIPQLVNLKNLTELNLWDTHVSDISYLANLMNLTELNLSVTQVSDISYLENLMNLTELNLSGTQVSDISRLANLTSLTELHLSVTQVSDISNLANLTNLTNLNLWNTQVSDISPLGNLTNLTELYLSGPQVTEISPLASLTNLKNLSLSGPDVSDISRLANLTNLKKLDLSETQVSDISPLANLTNLTYLHLNKTEVSDISPLASLTNLTDLNLWNTQVSDISPIANLTNLTVLYLWDTQVSDISSLMDLSKLERIYIDEEKIPPEQIDEIKRRIPGLEINPEPILAKLAR